MILFASLVVCIARLSVLIYLLAKAWQPTKIEDISDNCNDSSICYVATYYVEMARPKQVYETTKRGTLHWGFFDGGRR